ncbi:hypothetical protein ACJX0J_018568, partial [Zea mays]
PFLCSWAADGYWDTEWVLGPEVITIAGVLTAPLNNFNVDFNFSLAIWIGCLSIACFLDYGAAFQFNDMYCVDLAFFYNFSLFFFLVLLEMMLKIIGKSLDFSLIFLQKIFPSTFGDDDSYQRKQGLSG